MRRTLWLGFLFSALAWCCALAWAAPPSAKLRMLTLRSLAEWKDHRAHRLAFAPDGHTWASGDAGVVALYHDDKFERTLDGDAGPLAEDVAFSADGTRLFAGPSTWDRAGAHFVDTGSLAAALGWGLPSVSRLSFAARRGLVTPDGNQTVLPVVFLPSRGLGPDPETKLPVGRLLLLAAQSFEPICVLMDNRQWDALAASTHHIAGVSGKSIFVFDRTTHQKVAELRKQMGEIGQLVFSPDGKFLASVSAGRDHLVVLWDTSTWREARSWSGDEGGVRALAFHPTLPLVFTGGDDHHLKVWSLDEGKLLQSIALHSRIVGIALSPKADRLAVAEDLPARLTLFFVE